MSLIGALNIGKSALAVSQAAIQTTTEISHWSKSRAKLSDSMNAMSAAVPTTETASATFHRATLMSSDSAASVAE